MEKFLEAKGVDRFSVYLMDYGAPIGYRSGWEKTRDERMDSMFSESSEQT